MCMHGNLQGTSVQLPGGDSRSADGTLTRSQDRPLQVGGRPKAEDIPLGTGLANTARNSILARRDRIRKSIEASE